MKSRVLSVSEYAKLEGVTPSAINKRIKRGTCYSVIRNGLKLVFVDKDRTIKKPRKVK
jgi:predicted DNA-binding protein YlxM (UPF0122 family)